MGDSDVELETLVRDAEAAQRQAVKIAKSATLDGIQILGGAGFIQDHPVEMWARNAAAMEWRSRRETMIDFTLSKTQQAARDYAHQVAPGRDAPHLARMRPHGENP